MSFFRRLFSYVQTSAIFTLNQHANPEVQIQESLSAVRKRHRELSSQAAALMGHEKQLHMRLTRKNAQRAQLTQHAQQVLSLASSAREHGDESKAKEYEQSATLFVHQLIETERAVSELESLHRLAYTAAQQAKETVGRHALVLESQLTQHSKLRTELEVAKMQEKVNAATKPLDPDESYLEGIQDKIDQRYALAMGHAELASQLPQRTYQLESISRDAQASLKLAQLRAALEPVQHSEQTSLFSSDRTL